MQQKVVIKTASIQQEWAGSSKKGIGPGSYGLQIPESRTCDSQILQNC